MPDGLVVPVGADISDLDSKMGKAGKIVDGFAGGVGKAGGLLGQAFSFATGGLIEKGVEAIGGAFSGFFGDAIGESNAWNNAMSQSAAVIKSTGGAAGLTAQQMGDLASSLSGGAGVSKAADDSILAGEDLLATFTNIKSTFPQATATMVDMAAAMGTDVKGQAIQLGKALNDPIAGIGALSRVGVTFTKEQKDQIAAMVAVGDTAGAQKVILGELGKEFGGSALAQAKTFDGQMFTLSEQFANVKQSVGDALIPILSQLAGFTSGTVLPAVQGLVDWLSGSLPAAFGAIGGALAGPMQVLGSFAALLTNAFSTKSAQLDLLQALPGWLQPIGQLLGDLVGNIGEFVGAIQSGVSPLQALGDLLHNNFVDLLPQIGPALGGIGGALAGALGAALPALTGALGSLWTGGMDFLISTALPALGTALTAIGSGIAGAIDSILAPSVTTGMSKVGGGFFDWIGTEVLPRVGAVFGTVASAIGTWITGGGLAALVGNLQRWGAALVAWIGPMIPPLLSKLGDLLSAAGGWMLNTGLPTLVSNLQRWGGAFLAFLGTDVLPFIGGKLGDLGAAIWGWITGGGLAGLLTNLHTWSDGLLNWLGTDVLPFIGAKLGDLGAAIWGWITGGGLTGLLTNLHTWSDAFLNWVGTSVLPFIGGKLGELGAALIGWIGTEAQALLGAAGALGSNIITGALNALAAGKDSVIHFIEGIASGALDAIKNFFGISSPSTKMYDIFTNLIAGGTNALAAGTGAVQTALTTGIGQPVLTASAALASTVGPALATLPAAFAAALAPVSALFQAQAEFTDPSSVAYWWAGNPRAILPAMGGKIDQGSASLKAYAGPAMKGVTDYVSAVIHNEMPSIVSEWQNYLTQMVNATATAAQAMKSALGSIPTAPGGGGPGTTPGGVGGGPPASSGPPAGTGNPGGAGGGNSGIKGNLALGPGASAALPPVNVNVYVSNGAGGWTPAAAGDVMVEVDYLQRVKSWVAG